MSRKVFTYKDTKEAEAYIGKSGWFSDSLEIIENIDHPQMPTPCRGTLAYVLENGFYHFERDGGDIFQYFSPDPEPVETRVPFTVEDAWLFAGKFVRDAVSWGSQLGSMIIAYHLKGVHIVVPGTGAVREIVYSELWARFVFLDGQPCGKKVTQ